jgi:hypothetical protein
MDDFLSRASPWAITLVLHNFPAMIYAVLIVWLATRAYLRPSRRSLLLLYGTCVLLFAFEYVKHGTGVARETTNYLFGRPHNLVMRNASQFLALQVLPVAFHILGVMLLLLAARGPQRSKPASKQSATPKPQQDLRGTSAPPLQSRGSSSSGPRASEYQGHAEVKPARITAWTEERNRSRPVPGGSLTT